MTIGNIHSKIRNSPSNNAWILVALLPVPPTCTSDSAAELRDYQTTKAENLHHILRELLGDGDNPRYRGIEMRCADGMVRNCFLRPCAWVADYLEYTKLYNLENKGCPVCEVSHTQLGAYWEQPTEEDIEEDEWGTAVPRDGYPVRQWEGYEQMWRKLKMRLEQLNSAPEGKKRVGSETKNLKAEIAELKRFFKDRKQKPTRSALWDIDFRVPPVGSEAALSGYELSMSLDGTLWKPDMLHAVYQGMFKHLMDWLEGFMKRHKLLKRFDSVWRRIPPYPGLITPTKGYRYVHASHPASTWSNVATLGK